MADKDGAAVEATFKPTEVAADQKSPPIKATQTKSFATTSTAAATPAAEPAAEPAAVVEHPSLQDSTTPLLVDPAVDDDANGDADSTLGSILSSASASLSSSVKGYIFENGRRYNAYRPGEYWGPNDDQEQDRMDMANHMFSLAMKGALFRSPITTKPQSVLDVGTGTGIWAMEFADQYPSAKVIGTDLSPIQPTWVPPNCKFLVDDFEDPWLFHNDGPFDFIHGRILCGSVKDWNKFFKQAYKHLKRGGWVEIQEYGMTYFSDDDPELSKVPSLHSWLVTMKEIGHEIGKPFEMNDLGDIMEANRLVEVHEDHIKMPMGTWPADPVLKKLGLFNQAVMLDSLEPYTIGLLTHVRHWTVDECKILIAKVRNDITHVAQNKSHIYCKFRCTYGRRPLES